MSPLELEIYHQVCNIIAIDLYMSNLVIIYPYKMLANVNNTSAKEYDERCYKETGLPLADSLKPLQPHVYELAERIYLLMQWRNMSQAVITWFVAIV